MGDADIGADAASPFVRLRDVSLITMGQSPPSDSYNVDGIGLPFFQGKAEFGDLCPRPVKWCSQPIRVAEKDTVLVSVRAPIGDVNVSPSRCCIGRGLAAIKPGDRVEPAFLFYWLRHSGDWLRARSTGTTFQSINRDTLEEVPVWLPPISEQRAIARVLRAVRRGKEATGAVIAATRELKRSLMRHLFTYGPVPVEAANVVSRKDTELGPIPDLWRVVLLSDVCQRPEYGLTASALSKPIGPKFLRITDIQDEHVLWSTVP